MEAWLSALTPETVVPLLWNLVSAILIFLIGRFIARRISNVILKASFRRADPTIARFVSNLVYMVLLVAVAVMALEHLGFKTISLVAVMGAAGVAIGLSLKDSLSNFAAGIMLVVFRPFRVGDSIEAGGASGTVREIRIFATVLTSSDNRVVTVPNSAILRSNIVNFSAMPTRRVDIILGVGYGSDLKRVKALVQQIQTADERILKEPAPVVAVHNLADSAVELTVRSWVKNSDYWPVYWHLLETFKTRFDAEGIEIPFPQLDIHTPEKDIKNA